ncbi:MAG: DUF2304 domain-containing protein [Nitrospirae bacterium]|jgi:hypothetical protein|nr:DUF2304 domain-containing protein [Nitrospirota bacterium]
MAFSVRIFILLIGISLFILIFELVRRKKFREELSLIWLIIGLGLILSSFADLIIDPLAIRLGVHYPPVLVFLVIFFILVFATLYFSLILSDLKSKTKELGQKMALIEYELDKIIKDKGER